VSKQTLDDVLFAETVVVTKTIKCGTR